MVKRVDWKATIKEYEEHRFLVCRKHYQENKRVVHKMISPAPSVSALALKCVQIVTLEMPIYCWL